MDIETLNSMQDKLPPDLSPWDVLEYHLLFASTPYDRPLHRPDKLIPLHQSRRHDNALIKIQTIIDQLEYTDSGCLVPSVKMGKVTTSGSVHLGAFGYPSTAWRINGKKDQNYLVAVLLYSICKGPILPKHKLYRTCMNVPCCNPDHMIMGTNREVQKMIRTHKHWTSKRGDRGVTITK